MPPEYLVSDNNGNILAKEYNGIENLGNVSIDMPLSNYHDGEFFSVYRKIARRGSGWEIWNNIWNDR